MSKRDARRDTLEGFCFDQDRLFILHTEQGAFPITDYNDELTGFHPKLREIDPKIFHYGGNAYYITGIYALQKGWRVEEVEDRR
jgi:hypothetical protein